jgi:hypothetical protein
MAVSPSFGITYSGQYSACKSALYLWHFDAPPSRANLETILSYSHIAQEMIRHRYSPAQLLQSKQRHPSFAKMKGVLQMACLWNFLTEIDQASAAEFSSLL